MKKAVLAVLMLFVVAYGDVIISGKIRVVGVETDPHQNYGWWIVLQGDPTSGSQRNYTDSISTVPTFYPEDPGWRYSITVNLQSMECWYGKVVIRNWYPQFNFRYTWGSGNCCNGDKNQTIDFIADLIKVSVQPAAKKVVAQPMVKVANYNMLGRKIASAGKLAQFHMIQKVHM